LNINVPDSPRRHAPCPACGGKDRFRFDDNGRGSFICNQCGAGDGLDLIKRVNNCDTTEAALLAADVLGIDYRTTETPEATSQKREQLETERQRREQERLKRAEKDEQQRRDTFSRQFDDMRRKAVNGKSDYLVAKGVGDFTFPVLPDGSLLLALVDKSGAVTAAQTITSHGEKRLLTGSAKRGAYHAINAPETTQSILIAEGLATALSAHLIRPESLTVAAIDAGNLLYVAQVLRDKFPSAQIIIAADNDHSEGRQNTGRIAAEKAALSVSGWVALPPTDHKADWNDYHQKHGIKCATEAFNKSMYQPQGNGVKQQPQTIEGSDFKVMDTDPLKPRIESREDGIYWVSPRADSQSGEIINNESWLCSPLSVIGTGRDDKDQYLILRWLSFGSETPTTAAIPLADIGEREGWRTL
ncbi:TPA: toprim domain-containing protein, partial [Escherichia coli]|nr:toprim domain-containing protein [Escherichia coli]EFH2634200.1 toprim domain-containing protein [Escherichia coli]EFH3133148.1 toprim domain-containing protein [Escherichia coli]EFH5292633.1 DNA primase [Escherichia coli]EFH5895989.1 toprim domain-containing protein [Escherichia coli]